VKLIDSKSVLLGLGIGIIITSLLGLIFFAGYEPKLSDAQIISLARKLGMVDQYESGGNIRRNEDGSLIFTIYEGEDYTEISKRLYNAGIIESSIEFDIMIKKGNLEEAIKPGEYSIRYSDDTKSIIKKITGTQ
jgi:cell division protein YceG involved in septum cleavage